MHVRRLARWQIVALMAPLPGCSVLFPVDVDEYAKVPPDALDGPTSDGTGACFELIAAHPLPDPIDPGAYLSGPGVVATKDGFVIAYREQTAGATKSRVTSVVLDDQGVLAPAKHIAFDSGCGSPIPDDGVGIAWSESRGDGLAAVSQLDCAMAGDGGAGHTAGLTLIGFDGQGSLPSFNTVRGAGNSVSLAQAHSVAPLFTSGAFAVLSTIDQIPTLAVITPKNAGTIDPDIGSIQPIPVRSSGFAEIAASKDLLARLVVGTNEAGVGTSLLLDGGDATLSSDEAGAGGTVDDNLPDGSLGATVAVSGEQGLTAVITATGIDWTMRTLASAVTQDALDLESPPALGVDAAWIGTHAIVAASRKSGLELFRLPDAAAPSEDAGSVDTSRTMDLSNLLSAFDGHHFAIAGARGLVALAWLTEHQLQSGEPTGGYALFRCP
jgi:hypothetical protein